MQINHLRRREFITHLGGAAVAFPLVARAQQPERVKKIGVFMFSDTTDVEAHKRLTAFQQRLQQLGWTEGRSIRIDYRRAN
jgi:putative ABC transport system substrate-binding protein